jgi:hypothetical protein
LMELIVCKIQQCFQLFLIYLLLTSKFLCLLLKVKLLSEVRHLGDDLQLLWLRARLYFIRIYDKLQLIFLLDFINPTQLTCTQLKKHLFLFLRLFSYP